MTEDLIVRACELRREDGALHRVIPCKNVFALLGSRRTDVSHAGTGPLRSPLTTLASVGMMCHAKVRTVRRSSLALFLAVIEYGEG